MSRRRSPPPDSLELLLDTLCNTFGGVLFISMLVAVLLQLSGPSPEKIAAERPSSEEVEARRALLESLREEIALLQRAVDEQQVVVDHDLAEAIRKRREQDREMDRAASKLRERRDHSLLELGAKEVHILKVGEELADLADALESSRKDREFAAEELARERKARTRSIQAPAVKQTRKISIALELRYGRLYVMHKYQSGFERTGPNEEDYDLIEMTTDGLEIHPKPTGGIAIEKGDSLKPRLLQRIGRFPRESCYLDIIARVDSFDVFGDLRTALTELGYEISILPVGLDDKVIDRGGTDRGVQ